jgi:hypothetical protein
MRDGKMKLATAKSPGVGSLLVGQPRRNESAQKAPPPAGWETRDTADLEVCAANSTSESGLNRWVAMISPARADAAVMIPEFIRQLIIKIWVRAGRAGSVGAGRHALYQLPNQRETALRVPIRHACLS